jgi:hypothetical protein
MKRRWLKITGIVLVCAFLALWAASAVVGTYLVTVPRVSSFELRDSIAGKPVESVNISTPDGMALSGWLVPNSPDNAVILLPGIGHDRRQCVRNAEFYIEHGFTALMADPRSTGYSSKSTVSIGWNERNDLIGSFNFLREKGYKRIGAHGFSMGAATICFAAPELPDLAFIVLESCYDTLDHAVNNRLDMFHVPHFLSWPMRIGFQLRTGACTSRMRPVDFVAKCKAPALVLGGDSEGFLKVSELTDIYDHCASTQKKIHIFKGGRHEIFLRRFKDEAGAALSDFLQPLAF